MCLFGINIGLPIAPDHRHGNLHGGNNGDHQQSEEGKQAAEAGEEDRSEEAFDVP